MNDGGTPTEPGRERPQRQWWHRYLAPEERRRVMIDIGLITRDSWAFRFTVMLTLSVVVAVMGLSADSAAVVIGAMLLAPLMTPVLGLAASLSMVLPNKISESALRVGLATIWCIAVAYALSLIIPDGALPNEVISRTSPDVRDLVVALAAGLAGSYATVRTDASSALPGVAVAVALVPPLGTVGITLEAGRHDLAGGALLLYGANLAAIILAGIFVFVVTGFVPPTRLARSTPGFVVGTAVAVAVVLALAVPLVRASVAAARSAQIQQEVDEAVANWLTGFEIDVDDVDIGAARDRVSVQVSGLIRPPEQAELERLLAPVLGAGTKANVQWTRTEAATTTTIAPTTTLESDGERRLRAIQAVVTDWLAENSIDGNEYDLDSIALADDGLRVNVGGTGESPSLDGLVTRLDTTLDEDLSVRLTWLPRSVVAPVEGPTPLDVQRENMNAAAELFAADNGLALTDFSFDGSRLVVQLSGSVEPESTELVLALLAIAETEPTVEVFFIERRRLETTTTTTTAATTTTTTIAVTTTTNG